MNLILDIPYEQKTFIEGCFIFTDMSWNLTIARDPIIQKPNPTTYEMSVKVLHKSKKRWAKEKNAKVSDIKPYFSLEEQL